MLSITGVKYDPLHVVKLGAMNDVFVDLWTVAAVQRQQLQSPVVIMAAGMRWGSAKLQCVYIAFALFN